jgi:hypothetical protein
MVLFILVLNAFPGVPRNDLMVVITIVVCGVAEYGAWKLDAWRRRPRPAAAPAAKPFEPSGLPLPQPAVE